METKKINYNQIFKKEIEEISHLNKKPTLLLHACCGPCLTYPLSILINYFDVTVAYFNPNIYPEQEHTKRYLELKRFVDEYCPSVKVILQEYDYNKYLQTINGYENDKEGGYRCQLCHSLRLDISYKYAYENKYDYFTSVMTVSCKKPSALLNEICLDLQKQYPTTKYLQADFKKESGQLKGIILAKEHNLYRQNYCGCSFSLKERIEYEKSKESINNSKII